MKEEDLVKSIMERMTPYGKAMDEILEERVKETKAYKELWEENKKLNEKYDGLWKIYTEDVKEREEENKKLKGELERIKKELEGAKNSGEEFAYKRANAKSENKKLREELFILKRNTKYNRLQDKLVFDDSKTAREEQLKLDTRFMEEDTLQELRDLGEI